LIQSTFLIEFFDREAQPKKRRVSNFPTNCTYVVTNGDGLLDQIISVAVSRCAKTTPAPCDRNDLLSNIVLSLKSLLLVKSIHSKHILRSILLKKPSAYYFESII